LLFFLFLFAFFECFFLLSFYKIFLFLQKFKQTHAHIHKINIRIFFEGCLFMDYSGIVNNRPDYQGHKQHLFSFENTCLSCLLCKDISIRLENSIPEIKICKPYWISVRGAYSISVIALMKMKIALKTRGGLVSQNDAYFFLGIKWSSSFISSWKIEPSLALSRLRLNIFFKKIFISPPR